MVSLDSHPSLAVPCILVVEDNPDVRRWIQLALRGAPLSLHFAGGGAEAIAMYERQMAAGEPYRFLLLDAALPDVSGYQVLEHIRTEENKQAEAAGDPPSPTPAAFLTAYDEPVARGRAAVDTAEVWPKVEFAAPHKLRDAILAKLQP